MSDRPANVLPKPTLRAIQPAPDISPALKSHIEDLYRIGRTSNFVGMINIIFSDTDTYIIPHLGDTTRERAITAVKDLSDTVDELYSD